jgi:predicted amidohydrolase YtcJ
MRRGLFLAFWWLAAPAFADQILTNANGYTLGPDGDVQRFASLVLDDAGRVKAMLPAGAALPVGAARDMGGRVVLPGLIDAHARLSAAGTGANRGAREKAWAAAMAAANAAGVTMVQDAGTTAESWAWLKRQKDRGRLSLRVYAMADGLQAPAGLAGEVPMGWDADGMLAAQAVTFAVDGPLAARGAWLRAGYADRPATRGAPLVDEGKLRRQVLHASALGFQVDVQAHGDVAVGAALSALAAVPDGQRAALRHRVAALEVLDDDELGRFARLQVMAVATPVAATAETMALLGEARVDALRGWTRLAETGATVAGGSGGDVAAAMQEAVAAQKGRSVAALEMFTRAAAKAGHAEAQLGALSPGHWGDFIVIEGNPLAGDAQVVETWLAGKRVYRRRN